MFNTDKSTRRPAVAGSFYPKDPNVLRKTVQTYLDEAPDVKIDGEIFAVMAPHAGYVFSAHVAAPAYKLLKQIDFDTVVIIGHDFGRNAPNIVAVLDDHEFFETPLGKIAVDTELAQAMRKRLPSIIVHDGVHAKDHTVEIHLPFIQTIKPDCKILPVMFGEVVPTFCRDFVDALQACMGNRKILIFASSDMSHYPSSDDARETDAETMALIQNGNLAAMCARHDGDGINRPGLVTPLCATGGVGVAMIWAERHGADTVTILKQANSGDVSNDRKQVVGYGSAAFSKSGHGTPFHVNLGVTEKRAYAQTTDDDFSVSKDVQDELLKLVRDRITAEANGRPWRYTPPDNLPELLKPAAVFVTLHKNGRLRGCIGTTAPRDPLWKIVEYMAYSAAFDYPRFSKVTADEVDALQIEISVLSPMKLAKSPDEIVPFKHGVMVRQGRNSGLFLPQVWDQLPDKKRFMGYLCEEKAGIDYDAWKSPDTKIYLFTVFAFEEK